MNKKYVSYLRLSTKKQMNSGIGFDTQRNIINNYINNDDIVAEYSEVVSGKSINGCIELEKAINFCNEHGYILVTATADRLSRNQREAINIIERLDSRVYCCDCPDPSLLGIFFWFAEREREIISIRTKLALAEVKKRTPEDNKRLGKKPIGNIKGYDMSKAAKKSLEVRRLNRDIKMKNATVIAKREREHGSSLQSIANHLNNIGIKTSRDKYFTATTVRRLLK